MSRLPPTAAALPAVRWRAKRSDAATRELPEETPVALVHDGTTTAVMLATPADLEDFAVGFTLTEGIVRKAEEVRALEIVQSELGVEVRMWLDREPGNALVARRRKLAGPVGCGLCGIDSLKEAVRAPPMVGTGMHASPKQVQAAVAAMSRAQRLGAATRAVHAAGWWTPAEALVAAREDVGRHNALDKLAGALARHGVPATDGIVTLTSRVSVEMIQKAATMGAQVLAAVSAPTLLAVRTAEACGMTLCAVVRDDGFEVFTHPERIRP